MSNLAFGRQADAISHDFRIIRSITGWITRLLSDTPTEQSTFEDIDGEVEEALDYLRSIDVVQNKESLNVLTEFKESFEDIQKLAQWRLVAPNIPGGLVKVVGRSRRESSLDKAAELLRDQIERLHVIMDRRRSYSYLEDLIDEAWPPSQRMESDKYEKAVLEALLEQHRNSSTAEEEARFFASSTQFINRLKLQPITPPHGRVDHAKNDALWQEADGGLLELISYTGIERRQSAIDPAFETSYDWIFGGTLGNNRPTLLDSVIRGSGLCLIQGNEGSGKSTMMKRIHTDVKKKDKIFSGHNSSPRVVAAFYFWRNGTPLERSEEGLLRSLLHGVLSQKPQLIPIVFPKRWAALYADASDDRSSSTPGLGAWKVDELRSAFVKLIKQDQVSVRLLFLIDGVDEYLPESNDEDAAAIIRFLQTEIGSSSRAKAVISSRPLAAFEHLGLQPQVKLDDLNHGDVKSYVLKVLDGDDGVLEAKGPDRKRADALITQLLRKSGGTFLWAALCVSNIKSDLARGKKLIKVLEEFDNDQRPSLQNLYRKLWLEMPRQMQHRASQTVQIMLARTDIARTMTHNGKETYNGEGGMRLIDLALALDDSMTTVRSAVRPWPRCRITIQQRCNQIAEDFMTIWPDFITTARPKRTGKEWNPSSMVYYCHRSVPEFFKTEPELLQTATGGDFCPYIALLTSAVQQLKYLPPSTPLQQLWAFVTMALLAANAADSKQASSQQLDPTYSGLLDELDSTMQHYHDLLQKERNGKYLETRLQDPNGFVSVNDRGRDSRRISKIHWSTFHPDPSCSHHRSREDSFLSLAVQFGLRNYAAAKLKAKANSTLGGRVRSLGLRLPKKLENALRPGIERPLLDYALVPSAVAPYDLVKSTLVATLLEFGASPNDKFENKTLWERALQWQYEAFVENHASVVRTTGQTPDNARSVAEDRVKIFQLLIGKGPDLNASILNSKKQKISARKVLEESFTAWVTQEVLTELLDRFPTEQA